jgi:hypothetical protein
MSETTAYGAFRHNMDAVIVAYIECALWSESCQGTATEAHTDPDRCSGEDCDSSLSHDLNFGIDDMAPGAAREMEETCEAFVKSCLDERPDVFDGITPDMIGHDLWLTRNGHGVGFWDRGLGERGDWLTGMTKPFGDAHLYAGTDGLIYLEG